MTSETDRYRMHAWLPGEVLAGKYEGLAQIFLAHLGFEQCECERGVKVGLKTRELCPHDHSLEFAEFAAALSRAEQVTALRLLSVLVNMLAAAEVEGDD